MNLALGTTDERGAPELYAVSLLAGVFLMANTVDGYDGQSVGNGVTTHYGLPSHALTLLLLWSVARLIAYGCRVDEQFGTLKGHETCCLWIPLIPAYEHAKTSYRGVDGTEAEVARGEIELLVVGRIVGYVHLAILAGYGSVFFEDNSGVVVETCCATLKERCDEHYAQLFCQSAVDVGRGARDGLSEVEVVNALYLTEVE